MRWESEKWRKLYRRVDASWLRLPLLARGLGSELLKYADDDGRIAVMPDEGTGEAVCRIMGAHKAERRAVSELADKLVGDGYLIREPDALLIRNFVPAQRRSSNAERQARYRDRHANEDSDPDFESARDVTSNGRSNASVTGEVTPALSNEVTDRALSLSLSGISDLISADQIPEVPVTASARDSEPRAIVETWALESPAPARRKKRARSKTAEHPLPVDWKPTDSHREYAAKHGLHLDAEEFGFRGWAEGKLQVSWNGAFTTRLANQVKWAAERAAEIAKGRRPGKPPPVVQRGGWSREDAERNRPVIPEGDGF